MSSSIVKSASFKNPEEMIRWAKDLASRPKIFSKLMECLDDPDSTFEDMAAIVKSDPALVIRLLKTVNSPFYNLREKIESVDHAIQVLGLQELTSLILATTVISHFKVVPEDIVTLESFWSHSIATAVATVVIAEHLEHKQKTTLYTGAIIHDIGSLIIYSLAPEAGSLALERCNEWGESLIEAEKNTLGFTHQDVALALAKSWNLPEIHQSILGFHHVPFTAEAFTRETMIVHLADYMAQSLQLGSSGEHLPGQLDPQILETLGLDFDHLDLFCPRIIDGYTEAFDLLYRNNG
ncbi:MAG: HDOD domain-containing protein [Nitrospinaceae bacterium]